MDFNGNTTANLSSTDITVSDNTLTLATDDTEINDCNLMLCANNDTSDTKTSGFFSKYNSSGIKYAGLGRYTNGRYYFYKDSTIEPSDSTNLSTETRADLAVGDLYSNGTLNATTIDATNYDIKSGSTQYVGASSGSLKLAQASTTTDLLGDMTVNGDITNTSTSSVSIIGPFGQNLTLTNNTDGGANCSSTMYNNGGIITNCETMLISANVSGGLVLQDTNGSVSSNTIRSHINDTSSNPHGVDADAVGLGTSDFPTFAGATLTANLWLESRKAVKFQDSDNTYSAALFAPVNYTEDYNVILPIAGPTTTADYIVSDSSGNLSWEPRDQTTNIADDVTFNDLTVSGDLIVSGTTTTINTATVEIEDAQLEIASGNTTDSTCIGVFGQYSTNNYTGFLRDSANGDWWLVDDTTKPVDGTNPSSLTVARLHSCIPFSHEYISSVSATTITTKDVAVKVAGTFGSDSTCLFTTTGNRLTYTGAYDTQFKIDVSISFEVASANKKIEFFVSRNGDTFSSKGIVVSHTLPTASDAMVASITTIYGLSQDQYLEVWVANLTDTTNLTVNNCSMTVVAMN